MRVSSLLGRNASCCDFKQLFPRLAGVALLGGTGDARFVYLRAKQYRVEKMTQNSFRKHLSMPGMLSEVRKCFDNVPDLVVSQAFPTL